MLCCVNVQEIDTESNSTISSESSVVQMTDNQRTVKLYTHVSQWLWLVSCQRSMTSEQLFPLTST